jgi:hypothetical protein
VDAMGKLNNQFSITKRYFTILKELGYLDYESTISIVEYLFLTELLNDSAFSDNITLEDIKVINKRLAQLINKNCILYSSLYCNS